jgi:hypothetical protein
MPDVSELVYSTDRQVTIDTWIDFRRPQPAEPHFHHNSLRFLNSNTCLELCDASASIASHSQ